MSLWDHRNFLFPVGGGRGIAGAVKGYIQYLTRTSDGLTLDQRALSGPRSVLEYNGADASYVQTGITGTAGDEFGTCTITCKAYLETASGNRVLHSLGSSSYRVLSQGGKLGLNSISTAVDLPVQEWFTTKAYYTAGAVYRLDLDGVEVWTGSNANVPSTTTWYVGARAGQLSWIGQIAYCKISGYGEWPLDEGSGTSARDISGNGNTLAKTGGVGAVIWATSADAPHYETEPAQIVNRGLMSLDGTADYIQGAPYTIGAGDFYVRAKFKYLSPLTLTYLFTFGNSSTSTTYADGVWFSVFYRDTFDGLDFSLDDNAVRRTENVYTSGDVSLNDIVDLTIRRVGTTVFVEAYNATTDTLTQKNYTNFTQDFSGGAPVVIAALNTGTTITAFGALGIAYFAWGTDEDNLECEYPCEEFYGKTVFDSTGNNTPGLLNANGSDTATVRAGRVDLIPSTNALNGHTPTCGLALNGTTDYIQTPSSIPSDGTLDFSFRFADDGSAVDSKLMFITGATAIIQVEKRAGDEMSVFFRDNTGGASDTRVSWTTTDVSEFALYQVIYDGTTAEVFENGIPLPTVVLGDLSALGTFTFNTNVRIGARNTGTNTVKGDLSYAALAGEFEYLLDECDGLVANDNIGTNHGTIAGSGTWFSQYVPALTAPDYRVAGYFNQSTAKASIGSHVMTSGNMTVEADLLSGPVGVICGFGNPVNWDFWPGACGLFLGSSGDTVAFRIVDDPVTTNRTVSVPRIDGPAVYTATWDVATTTMTLSNGTDSVTRTGDITFAPTAGQEFVMGGELEIQSGLIMYANGHFKRVTYGTAVDGSAPVADYQFQSPTVLTEVVDSISANDALITTSSLETFWKKNSSRPSDALFNPITNSGGKVHNDGGYDIKQSDDTGFAVFGGTASFWGDGSTVWDDKTFAELYTHWSTANGSLNLWVKVVNGLVRFAVTYPDSQIFTAEDTAQNLEFFGGATP
jgi:hypothetical protein